MNIFCSFPFADRIFLQVVLIYSPKVYHFFQSSVQFVRITFFAFVFMIVLQNTLLCQRRVISRQLL